MNQKAQKQTIQWPPLYQLMHDEPVIDSTFRNVERLNAPYLNDMLSPVWVQDTEKKAVYDKDGNRYEITEGWLTRNGEQLFEVEGKKFKREDITEDMSRVHDYDITDNHEAYTVWKNKSFYIFFDNEAYATEALYDEGTIVASRIKIIDNMAILVAYYDVADVGYINVYTLDSEGHFKAYQRTAEWYKQTIRRNATESLSLIKYIKENASPIINIAKVQNGVLGISLVSEYGKAANTTNTYFITYFLTQNGLYQIGIDAVAESTTNSIEVTKETTSQFKPTYTRANEPISGSIISSDGATFYNYTEEGVKGEEFSFPVSYNPTDTGRTVTIDETEFRIYSYSAMKWNYRLRTYSSNKDILFKVTADFDDENYESEEGKGYVDIIQSRLAFDSLTPEYSFSNIKLHWNGEEYNLLKAGNYYTITQTTKETVNAGWLTTPNVVLDNGTLSSLWNINLAYAEANNWSGQTLTNGNIIEESGIISSFTENEGVFNYVISPTEYVTITSDYNVARSNTFTVNQNFSASTVLMNNASATSSWTLYNNGGTAAAESTASKFLEWTNSSATDLRYYPGTIKDTTFNYFGYQKFSGDTVVGNVEDQPVFTVQGYRVPVKSADRFLLGSSPTPFNILYNSTSSNTCLPQGISYSANQNEMGTLLTPWQSVDDDFYIAANSDTVVYRDKSNRYYKITIEDGCDLIPLLDDRFILVNTTSYWNLYDSVQLQPFHYATDYNDRLMFGQTALPETILAGANASGKLTYSRYTATAINAAYQIMPMLQVSSMLLPYTVRNRVGINAERAFNCVVPESNFTQPIDIYYGDVGGTACNYKYSFYPYSNYDRTTRFDLIGSTYTNSSNLYLSPNMFTEFISGAGNNDMVKETYSVYSLLYYDQIPFFLYSASTEVASKNGSAINFFVIQGQFYAFMNEKIYSMTYSSGSITSQDAIIDCRGMIFLGNNPQIAFFWSPRNRSIYSFTGDALLQHLYNADKLTGITSKHWYDETTQSIYIPSDYGLLVFGPNNTYVFEQWKDVTLCQFDNKEVTHITNGETTYNLSYYSRDGYEVLPLDLETSFYGLGSNELTAIDRWDIVLFDRDGTKPQTEIVCGVRSMTDISVKSEEKAFRITPDMWDKWSNSVLIRYVPKLQKGQGMRLYTKTPMVIQRIVPHIMDMNTGTVTKRGM